MVGLSSLERDFRADFAKDDIIPRRQAQQVAVVVVMCAKLWPQSMVAATE